MLASAAVNRPATLELGNYQLEDRIGEGGSGQVYRARGPAGIVAVKVLGPASDLDDAARARFHREIAALGQIAHPNLVTMLDHGIDDELGPYLVLPLLAGTNMRALGRVCPEAALLAIQPVVHAVAALHARGYVHRDLKPENVIVSPRGAVLIDFGLAALHDAAPLTQKGMCIGSPSYLAPERLRGAPHDERADLYALGVTLYEMLAGLKPFVGSTPEEVMHHALHRPPRPLRALRADIPAALEALVARALSKDPARRFGDAEELHSALAALDEPEPADSAGGSTMFTLAARPSVVARAIAWLRYGRWRWSH